MDASIVFTVESQKGTQSLSTQQGLFWASLQSWQILALFPSLHISSTFHLNEAALLQLKGRKCEAEEGIARICMLV